jgi:hypothetical protein
MQESGVPDHKTKSKAKTFAIPSKARSSPPMASKAETLALQTKARSAAMLLPRPAAVPARSHARATRAEPPPTNFCKGLMSAFGCVYIYAYEHIQRERETERESCLGMGGVVGLPCWSKLQMRKHFESVFYFPN